MPPEVSPEEGVDTPPQLSYEQMQAQLAASQEATQRAEGERDLERGRLDSFIQRGPQAPQSPTPAALQPLGPMPDQVLHPEEYQAWVLERDRRQTAEINERIDRQGAELRQEMAAGENRHALWTSFQGKYPKHAALKDLVTSAYQGLQSRGDLPKTTDAILDAVKTEMNRLSGTNLENISPPANRTAGISAGEIPASPKPREVVDEGEGHTIHEAVTARQLHHGLI